MRYPLRPKFLVRVTGVIEISKYEKSLTAISLNIEDKYPKKTFIYNSDYSWRYVIGHEILLSDVLEWFDKLYETNPVFYQDIMFQTNKGFLEMWRGDKNLVKIDLSKPRLADQSEELINFLYNLI